MNKAIVILTSFWDANALVDAGYFLLKSSDDNKAYKINIIQEKEVPQNFSVYSIALAAPSSDKVKYLPPTSLEKSARLDCFCPTYNLLQRYKKNKNWDDYKKDYYNILRERKDRIRKWIGSLKPNHIYILCCWENTNERVHCHRQLLYNAFNKSELASDKMLLIYRDGSKREYDQEEIISTPNDMEYNSNSFGYNNLPPSQDPNFIPVSMNLGTNAPVGINHNGGVVGINSNGDAYVMGVDPAQTVPEHEHESESVSNSVTQFVSSQLEHDNDFEEFDFTEEMDDMDRMFGINDIDIE